MTTTQGLRARIRDELIREIKQVARQHLARHGAAGLSVRAVTRELGMASSAVYRYFPSRDALLTALIVDAYEGVATAATAAESKVARDDFRGRWVAVFRAVRGWAKAHPEEYALIYGSPVPGYEAPEVTTDPASRVPLLLARVAADAALGPGLAVAEPDDWLSEALVRDAQARLDDAQPISSASDGTFTHVDPSVALRVIDAWTTLFGAISFELFGHYHRVVEALDDYIDRLARRTADAVGLPST